MKNKKALISLIGTSIVAVLFSVAWVNHGNTCATQAYAGHGKEGCGKKGGHSFGGDGWEKGGFSGGACGGFMDGACGGFMDGACDNLPSPCALLNKKDELGLAEDQVAKLKKLKSNSKKAKVRLIAELKILKIELQELLEEKSVDKNAVEAKLDSLGNLISKIAKGCVNTKLSAKELLTAEQLVKWDAVKKSCSIDPAGAPSQPKCDGKKKEGGQAANKDCGSSNWVDTHAML